MKSLGSLCRKCKGRCCRCHNAVTLEKEEDARRFELLGGKVVNDKAFGWMLVCPDGVCPFLKDGRCSIYDDRPWACIEFDCTDPRRAGSVVFEDFPELKAMVEAHTGKPVVPPKE